jgi:hypothetical protein
MCAVRNQRLEIGATCRSDEFGYQVGLNFEFEFVGW